MEKMKRVNKNFIPRNGKKSYDYFCTWDSQNHAAKKVHNDVRDVRNAINSDFLFSEDGLLNNYFKTQRENMIVLLDDGWDVPYDATNNDFTDYSQFGSLVLNNDRFPEFDGEPKERLKKLCDKIKAMGYGGVGLWICANAIGETADAKLSAAEAEEYWKKRALWCDYAGVEYWKVDWGLYEQSETFRSMLTETVHKYAPNLKIEHAVPKDAWDFDNKNPNMEERYKKILPVSDYFRTYDVLPHLSTAVTLYRVTECIRAIDDIEDNKCILNVEDEFEIAAVLGGAAGIMTHPKWLPERVGRMNALLNWRKISPPFPLGSGDAQFSQETLCDTYSFENLEKGHWLYNLASGKKAEVVCPMQIAVNTKLAKIQTTEADFPYVVTSKNPVSGAYSIGFLKRTINNEERCEFLCDAEMEVKLGEANPPIGVFGKFASLTFDCDKNMEGVKIYIQVLATQETFDITDCTEIADNKVKINATELSDIDDDGNGIIIKFEN